LALAICYFARVVLQKLLFGKVNLYYEKYNYPAKDLDFLEDRAA
jgi:hypothetical protein